MKKVAVFGNAGGGKSTLSRQLAQRVDLPLYVLDKIKFKAGGEEVCQQEYLQAHGEILAQEYWLIDGYGCPESLWQRLEEADTLIHVDLPIWLHCIQVTKRFLKGLFANPEGWPTDSPIWKSTLSSYRILGPCHRMLTPRYREFCAESASSKKVVKLRSRREIKAFLASV